MTGKELAELMEAEEKRLGLYSREFMERHFDIMRTADQMLREHKKPLSERHSDKGR